MATISWPRSSSSAVPIINSPSLPSGTTTPASRLSIDLPTAQSSNTTPASNQRRNRAALRDYYNLKAKQLPAARGLSPAASASNLSRTDSIASNTSEATQESSATLTTDGTFSSLPSSLDDPSFDAEAYVANLLKTSSLRDILRTESSLVSEIRNLDGERKALVYDNYSKLIVAVGTIGEMQRGISEERNSDGEVSGLVRMKGLEGKLDKLMIDFGNMTGGDEADKVARKLGLQERKADQKNRRDKDTVKWVSDAPDRLKEMFEAGKKEEAQEEWGQVKTILEKWKGVAGVEEVKAKCEKVFEEADENSEQPA